MKGTTASGRIETRKVDITAHTPGDGANAVPMPVPHMEAMLGATPDGTAVSERKKKRISDRVR